MWCHAVVPCCPFCLADGVGLCPFPVCAVLCCALRGVVRCRFSLCCCWCLVLWCVAVCGAVNLSGLWCGCAALLRGVVCRGVVLSHAVFCGALLPCGAVLLCCAVCSPLLRVFLSPLKKLFSVFENKNKILLYPTHAGRQAARPFWAHCLTCYPAASTIVVVDGVAFVLLFFFPYFWT